MRMIDDDQVEGPRQLLYRMGLEILQRALFPGHRHTGLFLPEARASHHRVISSRMAPGHSLENRAHSPNSLRIRSLCSPIRGAARVNFGRTPSTRSGEQVVSMLTASSRVTVWSMSRTENPSLARSSLQSRTLEHQISAGSSTESQCSIVPFAIFAAISALMTSRLVN